VAGCVRGRFGARRRRIACGVLWSVATVLTGLGTGLATLLVARVLLGLGEGATFPASTCAMSRWFAKESRGFVQGITHACARAGNTVAPMIVAAVMTAYGWRASFYVCAAISLAWVVLWAVTFT